MQTTSRVVEVAQCGRRTLSRPPRGLLHASRMDLTSSSRRIKLVRRQPQMNTQSRHRAVRSQAAAQQVSTRTLLSKDSISDRHRTRGTRQHPQQSVVSTAQRHLAARIVRACLLLRWWCTALACARGSMVMLFERAVYRVCGCVCRELEPWKSWQLLSEIRCCKRPFHRRHEGLRMGVEPFSASSCSAATTTTSLLFSPTRSFG